MYLFGAQFGTQQQFCSESVKSSAKHTSTTLGHNSSICFAVFGIFIGRNFLAKVMFYTCLIVLVEPRSTVIVMQHSLFIYIKPQSIPGPGNTCYLMIAVDHRSTSTISHSVNRTRGDVCSWSREGGICSWSGVGRGVGVCSWSVGVSAPGQGWGRFEGDLVQAHCQGGS